MEDTNAKMQRFFTACNELISGKFILADKKIGELLRSIATSDDLTRLFAAVTDGFDYPSAKKAYLKSPDQSKRTRGEAYLPSDRKEILAFVFCLLVEFDNGSMKFNDFLLRYFYEDGSYTASYSLFVSRMIRPFRDIVRECFPDPKESGIGEARRRHDENLLGRLAEKIAFEKTRVKALSLSKEDAYAGETMLSELESAVSRGDVTEIKALLCGYLYFLQAIDGSSDNSTEIFLLAGEL